MSEIDTLSIQIESDASTASKQVDMLASTLARLSSQLGAISKQRLAIDLSISGGTEKSVDRLAEYTSAAAKRMKNNIQNVFNLDTSQINKLKGAINDIASSYSSTGNVSDSAINDLSEEIIKAQTETGKLNTRWKDFYDTVKAVSKISVSPELPKSLGDAWDDRQGMLRQKVNTKGEGTSLDSLMQEWQDNYRDVFSSLPAGEFNLDNVEDQFKALDTILKDVDNRFSSVGNTFQEGFEAMPDDSFTATFDNLKQVISSFTNEVSNAKSVLGELSNVNVENTGFKDLASGIKTFANIDSTNMLALGQGIASLANGLRTLDGVTVNTQPLLQVSNALGQIGKANAGSTANLSAIALSLNEFVTSMSGLSSVGASINLEPVISTINSVSRLGTSTGQSATANLPIIASNLRDFITSLNGLGGVNFDVESLSALVSGISKLGNKAATQAAANLPTLSEKLREFISGMSSLKTVDFDFEKLNSLTSAISKLGSKTATKAASGNIEQLAVALKNMMSTLSTAPQVSQNVVQMAQALAQLGTASRSVNTASMGLTKAFNTLTSGSGKTQKSFGGLAATLGKFYATYWMAIRALSSLGKAIDISSDLTEVQNVVDVTFGDMTDKMNDFADTALQTYGMSELAAKQIGSRFQAMGVAMGYSTDAMSDMSIELTKLAADMASFYNVEQEDVAEDLESIFTGQTRPLRTYGLDLTQATVQEWALKNGIDADMQSMSQAEKTMLRYQYVMANTATAQGDFARTSGTWHNQLVLLAGSFEQLGSIVGGVLVNAFKPFVSALNSVMSSVIGFAQVVSDALGAIFGWKYESGGGVTSDMETAASAAEDLDDATGGAADNAEKMNRYIAGWQEVNNMTTSDSGSGGGGGGGGGGGATSDADGGEWVQTDSLWDKYTSDIDTLYDLGAYISKTLTRAMNSIDWGSIYESARNFGTGLAAFLNGLINPELFAALGRTIAASLNTIIYAALSFGEEFDWENLGSSIAAGINTFFGTFDFADLANTIDTWVQGIWTTLTTAISEIHWDDVWEGITEFIGNLDLETVAIIISALTIKKILGLHIASAALELISSSLKNVLGGKITTAIAESGTELSKMFSSIFSSLATTISGIVGKISSILTPIGTAVSSVFSKVGTVLSGIGTAISNVFTTLTPYLSTIAGGLAVVGGAIMSVYNFVKMLTDGFSWFNEALMLVGTAVTAVGAVLLGVAAAPAAIVAGITAAVATLVVVVHDNWTAIVEFLQGIPEMLSGVWTTLTESITGFLAVFDFAALKELVVSQWTEITDFFSTLPETIGTVIQNILTWFDSLPENIGYALGYALGTITAWAVNVYEYLCEKIPEIISAVVKWFSEMPGKISSAISTFISNVQTWGSNVYNAFSTKVSETIAAVVQWFSEMPGKIYTAIITFISNVQTWASETYNTFSSKISEIIAAIVQWFSEAPGKIYDEIIKVKDKISTWASETISYFQSAIPNIISAIVTCFSELPQKMSEIGDNLVKGLWNGITSAADWLMNNIRGFCSNVISGYKDGFDENSPSKIAFEIGDFWTVGLGEGFEDKQSEVLESVDNFVSGFSDMLISAPTIDLGVDTSGFNVSLPKLDSASLSGSVTESLDYYFASGIIDYDRLGTAVYQAQSQALQENPPTISATSVFDANRQKTKEFINRTGKMPYPVV